MTMRTPFLICTPLLIGFVFLRTAAFGDAPTELRDEIWKDLSSNEFNEYTAKAFAEKYGTSALPILKEMLDSSTFHPYSKGIVAFHLGIMRDTTALTNIVQFVETPLSGDVSGLVRRGLHFAIIGIGFLVPDSDDALAYLQKLVSRKYWDDRQSASGFRFETGDPDSAVAFLRRSALEALALSGTAKSSEAIHSLLEAPDGIPDANIREAIRICARRMDEKAGRPVEPDTAVP